MTGRRSSSEAVILERVQQRIKIPHTQRVIVGIGDDCAVYRSPNSSEDLVLTTDLLVESVHFLTSTHRPADIGHKALARGLSDIAAMGATPRFCLLSLAVPKRITARWIDAFYEGLLELADEHDVVLAGGDLSRSESIMCDIVCGGSVARGEALLRNGASAGDAIYVTGALGGSALGLATNRGRARARHLRPTPRIALGKDLRRRFHATAAMDISDGISIDLARLCAASDVAANIDAVPLFPGATLEQALHGGEDYELLFTVPAARGVPRTFHDIPLTRVGTILDGPTGQVQFQGEPLPALGHDHFRK